MNEEKENMRKMSWSRRRSLKRCNNKPFLEGKIRTQTAVEMPTLNSFNNHSLNQLPIQVLPLPSRAQSMQDISTRPLSAVRFENKLQPIEKLKSVSQFDLNFIPSGRVETLKQKRRYRTRYAIQQHLIPITEEINENNKLRRKWMNDTDDFPTPKKRNKPSLLGIKSKLNRTFGRRRSGLFIKSALSSMQIEENNNDLPHGKKEVDIQPQNTIFHNFNELLQDADKCCEFHKFLSLEHSEENLDFWRDCEKYKTMKNSKERTRFAKKIFKRYLSEHSTQEINLLSTTKQELSNAMQHPNTNTFDLAQDEIYKLMQTDSYPRFISSKLANSQKSTV